MTPSERPTEHRGGHDPGEPSGSVRTAEALEAAVEGVPGAVSLAPGSVMPALGGELVLPAPGGHGSEDVAADTVRAGLLQAGPLAVAGLVANGASVVVTVVLARLLTTRGYGSLNQLLGLFLIVSMPGSAVIVAVVRRVTAWRGGDTVQRTAQWARRVHRQGTALVVVFAIVVVACGPWIARFLRQPGAGGVDAILVAGAVWILLCLDRGLLQSHREYRLLAVNLLVEGGMRCVAMLALVAAGFGSSGAAVGVLIAEVVTAVHARRSADRVWGAVGGPSETRSRWTDAFRRTDVRWGTADERRDVATDFASAFVALATIALLQNVDVIMVGRENPAISGSYAAVSVASKAIVFGAIVLGGYLLPEAAIRWRQGGHALRQLGVTLLILAVPATVLLAIAIAAPRLLLTVVFTSRYLGAVDAFLPLVLAMVCLAVTVVLTMYLLAVGRRWITVLLVVGGVAATAAVAAAHGHPVTTARADLLVQAALALAALIGFVRVHHRRLAAR